MFYKIRNYSAMQPALVKVIRIIPKNQDFEADLPQEVSLKMLK